ncbi:MAG: hypothetical protein HW421_1090 [Ignavibacteria bacterium]|nr:hypothetical protein [Ignavibacteria bacterium]
MEAIKFSSIIKKNGELLINNPSFRKGVHFEAVILIDKPMEKNNIKFTGKDLIKSDIVGMWKDRNIIDSVEYTNALRSKVTKRELI